MSENLDSFIEAYNSSFIYDLDNSLLLNWYPDRILKLTNGKTCLDLGLGHGYSANCFATAFEKYIVLEGSEQIIKQFLTQYQLPNVEIVHTLFEEYESNEQFDVIIMGFVLEHVDNPQFLLQKYKQFLSPDGNLFITVPNCEALNKRFGYEAGMINSLWDLGPGDIALGHKQLFTVNSLKALVEQEGFIVKETEGIFLKPITTQQILDLRLSQKILQAMLKVGIQYPELCVGILMKLELAR